MFRYGSNWSGDSESRAREKEWARNGHLETANEPTRRRRSRVTIPVDIENMPFDVSLAHRAHRPADAHGEPEDINI